MKRLLRKYWLVPVGVFLGATGGWAYWYFVGCTSGSCPITSSPVNSSIWGALMGGLLFSLFIPQRKKEDV